MSLFFYKKTKTKPKGGGVAKKLLHKQKSVDKVRQRSLFWKK